MAPAPPQNLASFHQVVSFGASEELELPPVLLPADAPSLAAALGGGATFWAAPSGVAFSPNLRIAAFFVADGLRVLAAFDS